MASTAVQSQPRAVVQNIARSFSSWSHPHFTFSHGAGRDRHLAFRCSSTSNPPFISPRPVSYIVKRYAFLRWVPWSWYFKFYMHIFAVNDIWYKFMIFKWWDWQLVFMTFDHKESGSLRECLNGRCRGTCLIQILHKHVDFISTAMLFL